MQIIGVIKNWNRDRGFGFAKRDDSGTDVFVHINDVAGRPESLAIGERISFEIGDDPRTGKSRAINVRLIDEA
jgi:CspA family cold shock protein